MPQEHVNANETINKVGYIYIYTVLCKCLGTPPQGCMIIMFLSFRKKARIDFALFVFGKIA